MTQSNEFNDLEECDDS